MLDTLHFDEFGGIMIGIMKRFDHLLLDIEGTVVLDKKYTPVAGAVEWHNLALDNGCQVRMITNNTTESPDDLFHIMRSKGFSIDMKGFYTCLTEAVRRMKIRKVRSCFVLGVEAVKRYLTSCGISCVADSAADAVLVGHDPCLNYDKLNTAANAIMENGAVLFTLHRNRRFTDETGRIVLSSGPIAKALENACLVRAVVCGKPDRKFFLDSIADWNVPTSRILMVSDDPFADLVAAKKLGMRTCWVLTGSERNVSVIDKIPTKLRPDYILDSVIDIPI